MRPKTRPRARVSRSPGACLLDPHFRLVPLWVMPPGSRTRTFCWRWYLSWSPLAQTEGPDHLHVVTLGPSLSIFLPEAGLFETWQQCPLCPLRSRTEQARWGSCGPALPSAPAWGVGGAAVPPSAGLAGSWWLRSVTCRGLGGVCISTGASLAAGRGKNEDRTGP